MNIKMNYLKLLTAFISGSCLWTSLPQALADEFCAKCGQQVDLAGNFAHYRADDSIAIAGAGDLAAAFREEVYGENFTITIAHLPAGKYTVKIGETEVWATTAGQRVFNVASGDTTLAKDFDIIAAAGGPRKVCYITGALEHEDDALKGPLVVSFRAKENNAKFNTFEIIDAAGASVVS
ncbi:MAG TPA: malectin domain-containing carbohydrate-binding protein, partial [Verrucomicrobiae bacterium]